MVFFSYSWKDFHFVKEYHSLIEGSGLMTWIDINNLDLNHTIEPQLKRLRLMEQRTNGRIVTDLGKEYLVKGKKRKVE